MTRGKVLHLFRASPRLLASVTGVTGLLAILAASPAFPQAAAKRQELREVQRQLEQKKAEILQYRRQAERLRRDVSQAASETSESRGRVRQLEASIREAERKKGELKSRLGALQLAENQWRGVVSEEVNAYLRRRLLEFGPYGRREVWEASLRRAAIVEKLDYVGLIHGSRLKTEAAQAQARLDQLRLRSRSEAARREHEARETFFKQKKELYDETKQRAQEARRTLKELQESALALTQLVRQLERRTPYKARGGPIPPAQKPHSLPWPARGRLTQSYGRQKAPQLDTWVIHSGIRIQTAARAEVRPVKPGRVIFSGEFRSYGQVIIVDHGGAFYTIYGLLGRRLREKGDAVTPSKALGTAGDAPDGGTLYFEMRQSGDALDPLSWLEVL